MKMIFQKNLSFNVILVFKHFPEGQLEKNNYIQIKIHEFHISNAQAKISEYNLLYFYNLWTESY